jgi:hypothetical protein
VLSKFFNLAIKPADTPIDLGFVSAFSEKLDTLDLTRLTAEQKTALDMELTKLRSVANQKLKLLKK